MMEKIAADERIIDEEGEHIGFWNLKQRLRLLYGNRAKVELRNVQPHGAMVELKLPFSPDGGTTV
jgi:two-component system sensor histidine kinase YesM